MDEARQITGSIMHVTEYFSNRSLVVVWMSLTYLAETKPRFRSSNCKIGNILQ